MRCPKCHANDDKVIDSREAREGTAIRRRRVCQACDHRFTTYEEVVRVQLQVVKRDGRRQPLGRDKIQRALDVSCQKLKVSAQDKTELIDAVINEVEAEFEGEVPSTAIGEKVMVRLIKLDEVAYVRFASVYRRFRDVNEFMSEAERVLGRE